MPMIISLVLSGLLRIAGSLAGRIFLALGFGFIEFIGISMVVDSVKAQATAMFDAVGASVLAEWAGFFRIDTHLTIILSAISVKLLLSALSGDKVRKLVQK